MTAPDEVAELHGDEETGLEGFHWESECLVQGGTFIKNISLRLFYPSLTKHNHSNGKSFIYKLSKLSMFK